MRRSTSRALLFLFTVVAVAYPALQELFLEGDLVFYNHIGGHITTPEETAKYYEMIGRYFKVK